MEIYYKLLAAGVKIDSHESDLYAEATPEAIELSKNEPNRSFFTSQIDGKRWIEIPFAYMPYWEKKSGGKTSSLINHNP